MVAAARIVNAVGDDRRAKERTATRLWEKVRRLEKELEDLKKQASERRG